MPCSATHEQDDLADVHEAAGRRQSLTSTMTSRMYTKLLAGEKKR